MGLLNKLKNVLFEEEEIEIPEAEVKPEVKEKPIAKKNAVKMTFQDDDEEIVSDRELFKAEPTFNFPMFDEKEFEEVKKEEKPINTYKSVEEEYKPRAKAPSVLDIDRGRSRAPKKTDYSLDHSFKPKKTERTVMPIDQRKFHPSPVISPVYGILDKNYKKEDIVVRTPDKKVIDVDSVRKKAFGTLEDDIEKTLSTPVEHFYEEPTEEAKAIDELLKETIDDSIVVPSLKSESRIKNSSFNIEEDLRVEPEDDYLEVLDRKIEKTPEEKLKDETLENDLFDLIDSMYDNREDGE